MKSSDAAVVQVFVQSALFDWLEPYKAPVQMSACGTAFFVDEAGHLLTNYHVVAEAASIQMQAPSCGRERFNLEVVGVYPERDLALLRLAPQAFEKFKAIVGALPCLELGDSDALERGAVVTTVGYPLGQETLKVTQGVVSGLQEFNGEPFLQITAPLNEGNSGGPCLDAQGLVVGINTAIVAEAQNIGYAMPISDLAAVLPALRTTPLLRRPVLGCDFNFASQDMLAYLGNPPPGGVYLNHIYPGSALEACGVKEGDMLYAINGCGLDLYGDTQAADGEDKIPFTSMLQRLPPGDRVGLLLYRRGRRLEVTLEFEPARPLPIRLLYPDFEPIDYDIIGGLVIMELSLNHINLLEERGRDYSWYRLRANQQEGRLIITQILQNAVFDNARVLVVGDLIARINGQPVSTLADFRRVCATVQDHLAVTTTTGKLSVGGLAAILQDEPRLAAQYHYEPTVVMQAFNGCR